MPLLQYAQQIVLFVASFSMYGAPLLLDAAEGVRWYITPSFVAFHVVPGTIVGSAAIAQILFGVTRVIASLALGGGLLMMFGPGLGPLIGILHFHVALLPFAIAYHFIPGSIVVLMSLSQIRQLQAARV